MTKNTRTSNALSQLAFIVLLSLWQIPVYAKPQSAPLRLAIESCATSTSSRERLACALLLHDSLCYDSLHKGPLDLSDNPQQCLTEAENPVFDQYLDTALAENKIDQPLQDRLQKAYRQWQHNIKAMPPQPLEPEYQYKLRRNADSKVLFFLLVSLRN